MARHDTKKPTHDICFVKERKGKKDYWTRIGAGWTHEDNGGLNLQFDMLPVDLSQGRIVVRVRTERTNEEAGE